MDEQSIERKLTAILSADVRGYSRLMGEDEVATVRTLTAYREVMAACIQKHRGRVVDSPGDNLLAEFASVVDAVQCAVEVQQELKARNAELPDERKMEFRIGINLGDVIVEGERIYGDGVNIASRVEGLAEGGGICISGTVYDHVENKLAIDYEYLGEQEVKNISKPVRVYRVRPETKTVSSSTSQPLELPDKPSIAVLPFVNMSDDPEQEYFSDGITEDIITDLSKLSGLFVISRNSSFKYKGTSVDPPTISSELGVRYVLEGSVRKAGNRVRVNAQLIDAASDYHVWADRFDREIKDIFDLQDEITQTIVAELRVKLTQDERQRLERKPTDNLEAYDFYLRGVESYRQETRGSIIHAREMFERAISFDPQFSEAYAFLSRTYWHEHSDHPEQGPATLEQALTLAQKAIAGRFLKRCSLGFERLLSMEEAARVGDCRGQEGARPQS